MRCRLTKHGRTELVLATLIAWGACAAAVWAGMRVSQWFWGVAVVSLILWAFIVWFFRDPDRNIPQQDGIFISPADGRVADITQLGQDSRLGCDGVQIGIFMSVFDVHVNRAPCDGSVEAVEHHSGSFLDARVPDASERNESVAITMIHRRDGRDYSVIVRQIAGLIARRIVTELAPRQQIRRGDRIGMIKFGSRLELLVPRQLVGEIRVRVGTRVRAGESILVTAKETGAG